MSFGERLRKARGKRSAEEIATALGLTPQAIYNYENETRIPKDSIKVKLANFYGTSVQALFFD